MSSAPQPESTLLVALNNSGGDGKTTFTELAETTAVIGGKQCCVVDVDPGNRGFLNRSGDLSATALNWDQHTAFERPDDWFREHVMNHDVTIFDTGANMLASGGTINGFLFRLCELAKQGGTRLIFATVTSPNKAGSGELVENLYSRFKSAVEVIIVRNNRDGSGKFMPSLSELGAPIINVPFLAPGLQSLRLSRRLPLHEVLRNPEVGFGIGTAMIAKWALEFASQQSIINVFGPASINPLQALATDAPSNVHYNLPTHRHVRDDVIAANASLDTAWRNFIKSERSDTTKLLHDAQHLWDARNTYKSTLG